MYRLKFFAILIITQAFAQAFATVNVIYNPEDSVEIERWLSEAPWENTQRAYLIFCKQNDRQALCCPYIGKERQRMPHN